MSEARAPITKPLGRFTRRPAVVVAILLASGILLHDQLEVSAPHVLLAGAIFALLSVLLLHRRYLGSGCLGVTVILLGAGLAQREHHAFAADDIGNFASDEPRLTELEVRLLDDPQISVGPPAEQRSLPPKQIVTGEVSRMKTWDGWVRAVGELPIQIDQIQPELCGGQRVRMLGMLQRPRAAANPGEFDWAEYYRQQRILSSFTVSRAANIHILGDAGATWIGYLRAKSRHALASGFTAARATEFALLDAMVLGDRDPQLRDIQQEFQQTGMGFQLSVSGLHIALLAGTVLWVCRFFRLTPVKTLLITTGFVILYTAISQPSHSGIRAAILSLLAAVAICSGRAIDRAQFLALAVIAMLLWHPMDLFSAGFHLSFAVVILFLILLPPLRRWMQNRHDPDDATRWEDTGFWHLAGSYIARLMQYSVLAWLATLPLVAYHFGQASSWSILGSLLLFPIVVVSLFAGVLKILTTLLWPALAGVWAVAAGSTVGLLEWGVHQLARLPGASVVLPAPPIWLILIYYLLLLAPLLPYRWRWFARLAPLTGVTAIFSLSFLPHADTSDSLKVTLLSLGAGQCAVVEPPGGMPILIDAGSSTVSDVARKIVEPFLRFRGESRIDEIFLSHGDFDHISAAGELATEFNVRQVLTSCHFKKNSVGNVPDELLLDELDMLGRPPTQIAPGDSLDVNSGAKVTVLWPPKDGDLNSNNAGLVLRLTFAGRSILFPADIQDPGFAGVLKNPAALKSDVLIAPHHGSSEDLTPAFLAAVHPKFILSSNLGRLTNKQKRFETMIGQTPLYRTPQCGAITVTISKDGRIIVTTFAAGASSTVARTRCD